MRWLPTDSVELRAASMRPCQMKKRAGTTSQSPQRRDSLRLAALRAIATGYAVGVRSSAASIERG